MSAVDSFAAHERPRVMVCMPLYRGVETHTFLSIVKMIYGVRADLYVQTWENTPVDVARAQLVRVFLESDREALLFIDSDSVFAPDVIQRLIEADRPIIGLAYPTRSLPIAFPIVSPFEPAERGTATCGALGFGTVLIQRAALERMVAAYPELRVSAQPNADAEMSALFQPMIEDGRLWGEDYSFCKRWRRVHERDGGPPGEIHVLCDAAVEHHGVHAFKGNLSNAMGANE